jgi:hypothetical protein
MRLIMLKFSRDLQSNGDKFSYRKQAKMHRQGSSHQPYACLAPSTAAAHPPTPRLTSAR